MNEISVYDPKGTLGRGGMTDLYHFETTKKLKASVNLAAGSLFASSGQDYNKATTRMMVGYTAPRLVS
jgi:hypothetical protein